MKFVDEFRDPAAAKSLLREIGACLERIGATERSPVQVMEVCGGHTHSIFRYALKDLVPPSLEFVHGPGCPVCVLPMGRVDDCIAIARRPEVIFTTFGDAMRVPGSEMSLLQARAAGAHPGQRRVHRDHHLGHADVVGVAGKVRALQRQRLQAQPPEPLRARRRAVPPGGPAR